MFGSQDARGQRSAEGQARRHSRVISGAAVMVMVLGVALMGYGAHFLAKTGNCSGTGYVSYGPVPKCGGGEPLYIMSAFFLGPMAAVGGWLLARAFGWLWPTFCVGMGSSMITLRNETTAASGAKTFGVVSAICLFALAVISVVVSLRKRRMRRGAQTALIGGTGPGANGAVPGAPTVFGTSTPSRPAPAGAPAASRDRLDSFDKIAKLAQLRDTGALTEAEFAREKAKLFAEM